MSLAARAALLVAIDVQKFTIGYAPNRDNLIHPGFASSISLTAVTRLRIPYAPLRPLPHNGERVGRIECLSRRTAKNAPRLTSKARQKPGHQCGTPGLSMNE